MKKITFKTLLTNTRVLMASVSSIFAMIFMLFMDPIYSNYLLSAGVSDKYIGYFFGLWCGVYALCTPIVGWLCKYVPKLVLTQASFVMSFCALIMFGPSEVLGFPQSITIMIIGNASLGLAVSFVFVPLLSEIIDAVKEKEGMIEDSEDLNDLSSGLFNSSYAIGCLLAPILGGFFGGRFGFRYTCDIMAFSSLAYAVVYFLLNTMPYIVSRCESKNKVTHQ